MISLVSHLGWPAALTVELGTNFATAVSSVSLKMVHALSAPCSVSVVDQFMFFKCVLRPTISALFQFGLVGLSEFIVALTLSSIFRMQWSLLPILPSSLIDMTLSGQLVMTRSSMLPLICVGKSTSCDRSSSSIVSRTLLPLVVELPSIQLISGRLMSPINIVFLSRFFKMLHSWSVF